MHRKVYAVIVQQVVGEFDEDGNLVGSFVEQPEQIFHPFALRLDAVIQQTNRKLQEQEKGS